MATVNGVNYKDEEEDLCELTKEELEELNEAMNDPDVSILFKVIFCLIVFDYLVESFISYLIFLSMF